MVVTGGGIHGKITGLDPDIVTLEIGERYGEKGGKDKGDAGRVRIKVTRNQITGASKLGQSGGDQK
jgi:preprotein translocase subunit YajC